MREGDRRHAASIHQASGPAPADAGSAPILPRLAEDAIGPKPAGQEAGGRFSAARPFVGRRSLLLGSGAAGIAAMLPRAARAQPDDFEEGIPMSVSGRFRSATMHFARAKNRAAADCDNLATGRAE